MNKLIAGSIIAITLIQSGFSMADPVRRLGGGHYGPPPPPPRMAPRPAPARPVRDVRDGRRPPYQPVRPNQPVRPIRRPIVVRPPRHGDVHDERVVRLLSESIVGLGCERAGEILNRLSSLLTGAIRESTPRSAPGHARDPRSRAREEARQRWRENLASPDFWRQLWERVGEVYRQCDLNCFENGLAIGEISGAGYCAASLAVDGLPGPGFAYQPPLPICQSAIYAGCHQGYWKASQAYDGCTYYTEGEFQETFREYQSQDCAFENGS